MSHEVFTDPWTQAWADELGRSDSYRQAAATWEGSLVLEMAADPDSGIADERAVFVDLWHGDCRAARVADADDKSAADYVIRADAAVWQKVLAGNVEPIFGLMAGKLKLERGSLVRLTPYARASSELVRAAARVDAYFPSPPRPPSPTHPPHPPRERGEKDRHRRPTHHLTDPALLRAPADPPTGGPRTERNPTRNEVEGVRSTFEHRSQDHLSAGPPERADRPADIDLAARTYQSTSVRGLDHDLPPMRLWRKSKKIGIWDPLDVDFRQDARDWQRLSELEREVLLHLSSLFQAGEESVTLDLLPLIQTIAGEGRLEEEMYLTAFLWEEAKHVELFRRFLDEVAGERSDLARFHGPSYHEIFYQELPNAMARLRDDRSPGAQAEASVTYNMIVEGVLAETGYHAYHSMLERNGLMPGMMRAVSHLKSDEARHMAYGVFLLSRLVAEHGEEVWQVIERRMSDLLPAAIALIHELFDAYDEMPFGLQLSQFVDFATSQFQRRLARIEKARRQSLAEICGGGS